MKANLKTKSFLAALVVMLVSGCSPATPTAAPAAEAPAPNMAGGVYEQAGYQLFHWTQGLTVLVWHDATQSSVCSTSAGTGTGMNVTPCTSVNGNDQAFDWQIATSDGLSGVLTFDGVDHDLASGNVFTITTLGEPVDVHQFQRDLSAVSVERETIIAFTNNDTNLSAFLKYAGWMHYGSADFGLDLRYPSGWFGPEVYTVDQDLRIEIGSDVVYPYGTDRTEQIYTLEDAYYILVEYSQGGHDQSADDVYQLMLNMQNDESFSDARSMITRVRQVSLGNFDGFEFISTLSETAQTEIFYVRQVILYGPNGSMLRITGQPSNVAMADKTQWREAYQAVDEANQALFYNILGSITIE